MVQPLSTKLVEKYENGSKKLILVISHVLSRCLIACRLYTMGFFFGFFLFVCCCFFQEKNNARGGSLVYE